MTHPSRGWRYAQHLLGILVLSGATLGCNRAPTPAAEKVPPAPVKWAGVRQLFLEEWTELVGSTEPLPDHAARVTAPVEGRVLSVLHGAAGKPVIEGQVVQAGDVLVRLDDTTLRTQRDKAESTKKVLRAEAEAAQFAVKQAALEVRRLEALKRQPDSRGVDGLQLISAIDMEKAVLALDAAKAHDRANESKLEAADEEIASIDRQLKLYTLTAPRKGRLGRLQVVVGQTLSIGTMVAEVVDIEDEIDLLCFVPAADVRNLQVGQPARIGGVEKDPTAEQGADPEGKVEYIADQAEAETGHFAVKVRFPNRDLKLRANSVVRIRILTKPGKACWTLPESALMEDQDPPGVVVVEDVSAQTNADGKEEQVGTARRLRAVIGVRDRVLRQVEVLRLEDPEKKWHGDIESALVINEKGQGLQTGDAVRLEEEEEEAPPPPKPEEKP
jgi:multidrug efflux pump subunit AcrA (membrane-fusion protein)